MTLSTLKAISYIARSLTLLTAVFFYLFIFEGFAPGHTSFDSLTHFFLATIVLILAAIAWRFPLVGGLIYIGLGIMYILPSLTGRSRDALIGLAAFFIFLGSLFLIESMLKAVNHPRSRI